MTRHLPSVRRLARRLVSRATGAGVVLMYHRVAEVGSDPWSLCVSPRHFEEHLRLLRERFRVVPLSTLLSGSREGGLARRAVAVTFDDGYADSLLAAKPLLERYGVPATVFVTAGQLGASREFWWDELERLLLRPGTLPVALELEAGGRRLERRIDRAERYTHEDYRRHERWTVHSTCDPTPRHALFRVLYMWLFELAPRARQSAIDALREWAGAGAEGRPSHRSLTREELADLASGGLVEIGAHTLTHPALDALPRGEQWAEISGSKALLEALAGRPVTAFAYPHGAFSADTVGLVREAGFAVACSTRYEAVPVDGDPYRVPRVEVRDGDGDSLARSLP
jgi:peptidoglycan/xylan/chitin deacetylase (PgdA/CDA1 family)